MSKVKLTTVSGQIIEKPIVSCFKGTYGTYLVLDNEANGSMGLPIILVTKIFNNKAIFIDDGEWQTVKENLKSIIAGGKMEYTTVMAEMPADDVFYKQLTLPVNSFDALKKAYEENNNLGSVATTTPEAIPEAPVMPTTSINPTTPTPIVPVSSPVMEPTPVIPAAPVTPVVNNIPEPPKVPDVAPVMPETSIQPEIPTPFVAPVAPTPVVNTAPVMPVEPIVAAPVVPAAPVQTPDPVIAPTIAPVTTNNVDYTELKENFMKSCESMFDALASKMQNK